jgi:hypothetical protein
VTAPDLPPEEPWEDEIHELLASLPPVDPPEGFLQRAVDHRPKYAARLSATALASVAVAALVIVGLGLVGDPASVAPAVRTLNGHHAGITAGLGSGDRSAEALTFERIGDTSAVIEVPGEFEPMGLRRVGEVVHLVYQHEGEPVSVFVQPGTVAWDRLPPEGLGRLGDRPVWVDAERSLVVLESGRYVVAIVGIDVDEALATMRVSPPDDVSLGDRFRALAREVARQAGFP